MNVSPEFHLTSLYTVLFLLGMSSCILLRLSDKLEFKTKRVLLFLFGFHRELHYWMWFTWKFRKTSFISHTSHSVTKYMGRFFFGLNSFKSKKFTR